MIESGKILIDGTDTFVPVLNRLWEIAQEFVPYFIFIAIGSLAIYFVRGAVKAILQYLELKSLQANGGREGRYRKRKTYGSGKRKNGKFTRTENYKYIKK